MNIYIYIYIYIYMCVCVCVCVEGLKFIYVYMIQNVNLVIYQQMHYLLHLERFKFTQEII
jgi:hypothetical protein